MNGQSTAGRNWRCQSMGRNNPIGRDGPLKLPPRRLDMQTKGTCQQGESSESSPELAGISERNDEDDGAPLRHTCLRLVALHLNLVSYLFLKKKRRPPTSFRHHGSDQIARPIQRRSRPLIGIRDAKRRFSATLSRPLPDLTKAIFRRHRK